MCSPMRGATSQRADLLAPLRPRVAFRRVSQPRRGDLTVAMAGHGRFFVGGNWKCNGSKASIDKLVADLNAGDIPPDVEVVVAPPFVYLPQVQASIKAPYKVAAQNCWVQEGGAFTGEVAPTMLADINVPWVILGHSERRSLCGETNEVVGAKCKLALQSGLKILPCVGETLEQREAGKLTSVLEGQMRAIANNVDDWSKVVIAYEPIWAIGTGVVATPEQAEEVHAWLRQWVTDNVGADVAAKLRILYGGSVNDKNCAVLASQTDVDGFLVGGASLQGPAFLTICNALKGAVAA